MLRILKWWEEFENAGSRKLKKIRHFSSNAGNDSRGYRRLMRSGNEGIIAFGVFQALCQCMATLSFEARKSGEMINSDGSKLDLEDISDKTRISEEILTSSIELLAGIRWVEPLEPLQNQQSATGPPSSANDLPLICHDSPIGEEGIGEEGIGGNVLAPTSGLPEPKLEDSLSWSPSDGWKGITDKDREQWAEAYPACDVTRQLAAMHQWLLSNPSKARKKAWRRFVTNWLSRKQESGGDLRGKAESPTKRDDIGGRTMSVVKVSDLPKTKRTDDDDYFDRIPI